ncbi:hypothetical protein M513_00519, partial [Trichuris suis]
PNFNDIPYRCVVDSSLTLQEAVRSCVSFWYLLFLHHSSIGYGFWLISESTSFTTAMSGKDPRPRRKKTVKKAVPVAQDEFISIEDKKIDNQECSSPLTPPPVLSVQSEEPTVIHETMPILEAEETNVAEPAITVASDSSVPPVGNPTDVGFSFSLPPVETNPLYWDKATLQRWLKHIPVFGKIILPTAIKYHLNGESFMICNVEEFAAQMRSDDAVKASQIGRFLRQCVRQWPRQEHPEGPSTSKVTKYHQRCS